MFYAPTMKRFRLLGFRILVVERTEFKLRHPGDNPGANLKSISHRCYLGEVALEVELTKEII